MNRFDGEERDLTTQYSSIGEYVVDFEFLVNLIRFQCSAILQRRGLTDWNLSEIIFGQKQFTADPLINCFESLCNELLKNHSGSEEIRSEIASFRIQFAKQISFRNDLLHSTHLYGKNIVEISEREKPSELSIIKNSPTKTGHRIKEVASSIDHVEKNITEINELKKRFMDLTSNLVIFMLQKNSIDGSSKWERK